MRIAFVIKKYNEHKYNQVEMKNELKKIVDEKDNKTFIGEYIFDLERLVV